MTAAKKLPSFPRDGFTFREWSSLEDDDFRVAVSAHSVDRPGEACPRRIPITAGSCGFYGNGLFRAANDVGGVKRRLWPHIDDKALMLGVALPGDRGSNLHAESGISLGAGKAGSRRGGLRGALDIYGTRPAASVLRRAKGRRIGLLASIGILLLRVG